jgi:hypothetical protein
MSNHVHVQRGKDLTVTITFQQALEAIQERRPCSAASLRRYFRKLQVKPLGSMRTNPRRYPSDAPGRILQALGEKVVTMGQLRAVKRQAQKARAA